MERPFDRAFRELMAFVTEKLVKETNARIGYTQSDEITLVFYSDTYDSQIFFNGKVFKMVSVLASMATAFFNVNFLTFFSDSEYALSEAQFDCRVWQVPTQHEATNVLVWREQDAIRNSIQLVAQSQFSHKQLDGVDCPGMLDMLAEKGIIWDDYPDMFKRGVYIQRSIETRRFTTNEIENLPPKHEARTNPGLEIERSVVRRIDMPPILEVENRVGVVFYGEKPRRIDNESEKDLVE
jgi:tRNA(His) 5'-end guanylyltransferase